MKIDNQDIIRTAHELRDEVNNQLNVSPWKRHHHSHIPTWLVAVPAAAIIGFIFGHWTLNHNNGDDSLTVITDTVYIEVATPQYAQESATQVIPVVQKPTEPHSGAKPAIRKSSAHRRLQQAAGLSVANDKIRYDLLVQN